MLDHQRGAVVVTILCVPLLLNRFLSLSWLITRLQYIFPNFSRESNARRADHFEQSYWLAKDRVQTPSSWHVCLGGLHFGLGLLDAPLTSGVFQVVFDSCTVRKVRVFIYILLLSENIHSEEPESCEKTPGETEGMEAVGNTSLIAGYHSRAQIKRTHMKHFEVYLQAWSCDNF